MFETSLSTEVPGLTPGFPYNSAGANAGSCRKNLMFGNQNIFKDRARTARGPLRSRSCNLFAVNQIIFLSIWMSMSGRSRVTCGPAAVREMVGLIGLEPMTPALSRRCSNQLSYRPGCGPAALNLKFHILRFQIAPLCGAWRHGDSNPRHPACKAGALPTELYPPGQACGLRFEISNFRSRRRHYGLRYGEEKDRIARCVPSGGSRGIFKISV